VTTGGSSLAGVEALRNEGALVNNCLTIVSYGFPQVKDGFSQAGVKLCALTNFGVIVKEAHGAGLFSEQDLAVIEDWRANPLEWGEKYGST
jgi:orotate phosphoribosyltransferase